MLRRVYAHDLGSDNTFIISGVGYITHLLVGQGADHTFARCKTTQQISFPFDLG